MPRPGSRRHLAPWALAALLALTAPALANMAEPPDPQTVRAGRLTGELAGALREVRVASELLRIDLRPLADDEPAVVEATYRVRNQGPATEATLWFVADGFTGEGHGVWLDGRAVPSAPVPDAVVPEHWRGPLRTPALPGGREVPYVTERERVIGFRVRLEPGERELRVRYPARPAVFRDEELMPIWQLAYVLSPAREWAGFGALEVRVRAPRGWTVAAEPGLRRDGGELVGRWDGIPADALALSARAPAPATGWRYLVIGLATLAGLLLAGWLGRAMGRALGARGRSGGWAALAAVPIALLLTAAALVGWLSVPQWVASAAGPEVNRYVISRMSYGGIGGVLLAPVILVAGFLAILLPAVRAAKRARHG